MEKMKPPEGGFLFGEEMDMKTLIKTLDVERGKLMAVPGDG